MDLAGLHPQLKQVLEGAEKAFERPGTMRHEEAAKDQRIAQLETKLAQKNEVVAELLQEHVHLKKELGEL